MPQVDHLRPGLLQYAAYDIDGRIMPVEQAGRRNKSRSGYRPFVFRHFHLLMESEYIIFTFT